MLGLLSVALRIPIVDLPFAPGRPAAPQISNLGRYFMKHVVGTLSVTTAGVLGYWAGYRVDAIRGALPQLERRISAAMRLGHTGALLRPEAGARVALS
jgi:hypothetical protein